MFCLGPSLTDLVTRIPVLWNFDGLDVQRDIHGTTDNLEQEDKARPTDILAQKQNNKARPTVILTHKDKAELVTGKGVMKVLEWIARMISTRKTGDVVQMEKPRPTAAAAIIAFEKR